MLNQRKLIDAKDGIIILTNAILAYEKEGNEDLFNETLGYIGLSLLVLSYPTPLIKDNYEVVKEIEKKFYELNGDKK
jgi:hypothetical protein